MLIPLLLLGAALAALLVPVALQLPEAPIWLPASLFVLGTAWAFGFGIAKGRRELVLLGVLHLAVGGGVAWGMFGLRRYVSPDGAPRARAAAPDIEAIRVLDGAEFRLSAERGRPVVLVFFRGGW